MSAIIDPETLYVDDLPGIWSPVQWELNEEERLTEMEDQATASLMWTIDTPEAVLRLLLGETEIKRAFEPPEGYDPEQQGEWDESLVTYQFRRPVRLVRIERKPDYLYVEYDLGELGFWCLEIEPEKVTIERI